MAKIKIEKTKDYTVMSNFHLRDKRLSLKAKGLLSLMLSLPDDWNYSIEGLVAICIENETAIKSAMKELFNNGYVIRKKYMPNQTSTGRIEYEYVVYESPKQESKKQGLENLGVETLGVENQGQLNINILNTNKQNKNNISSLHSDILQEKSSKRFKKPTLEEVSDYIDEQGYTVIPEVFYDYYEANGWRVGRNPVKDWKACVRTFQRNEDRYNNSRKTKYNNTNLDPDREFVLE